MVLRMVVEKPRLVLVDDCRATHSQVSFRKQAVCFESSSLP